MAGLGYDGSIRINTLINSDGFSKGIAKMSAEMDKKVKNSEKLLENLQKKREELANTSIVKTAELDAEKIKLKALKKSLDEIKAAAKDTSLSIGAREEAKSQIPHLLEDYKEQQTRVRMLETEWVKIENSIQRYDDKITDTAKKLEQQRIEAQKVSDSFRSEKAVLEEINSTAVIGNQRIVDLSHRLAELQNRQKTLESAGLGLGYQEYDANARKIASITAELKKYQSELQNTASKQNELQSFLGTLEQIGSSFAALYDRAAPSFEKLKDGLVNVTSTYFNALGEAFSKIGERLASTDYFQGLEEAVRKIGERLSNAMEPVYEKLANSEKFQKVKESFSGVLDSVKSVVSSLAQNIGPAVSETVDLFKVGFGKIGQLAAALPGKLNVVVTAVKTIFKAVDLVFTAIGNRIKTVIGQIKSAIQGIQSVIKVLSPIAEKIGGTISKAFSATAKGVNVLTKGLAAAASGIVSVVKNMNVFSRLSNSLESVFKRLGNTIKSALVFSVIYKGLSLVRSEMGSYLMVNQQFVAALAQIKGVLLTAFQPIYDVVVPALATLMNMLAKAIAIVSQFTASLFGTTAKKAQANAKALYEQAHAVEAVGSAASEAAKEAETAIAAFDEFNILSFPDASSGGGGGGGAGAIEMPDFDYEYDEAQFDSWGEAFSAFLDKLLDGIPKLEDAFKGFADWLNGFSQKLYDMFTFPGVLEKVEQLGRDLAGAFNKLVNWIDWNLLGKALGAGLNLALQFLTEFLYSFDWMNLGRKLADFVNGLASEIDWYDFGRLLWAGFKIALETLAGFILGLDMTLMGQAASNIIMGFFDEMKNTIERIPWYEIGQQIARFLNSIDWYNVLTSVISAIQAALLAMEQLIAGFVQTLQWSEIAENIYTAINDSFGKINWYNMGQTIGDSFVHIFDFVRQIIAGIHWQEIGKSIADFILGFDFVSALSSLAQLIAAGINAAVKLLDGFLSTILPELRVIAEGIVNGLMEAIKAVDWTAVGNAIGDAIKGALSFVAGLLNPGLFYEIGKAIGDFLVGLDWVGIIGGLAEVLANAIKSAVAAVQGFLESVKPHLKEIADGIADKINEFFRNVDWKEVGQTINDGINTALDFLIELIEQLNWAEIGRAIGDLISEIDWDGIFAKVCRVVSDVFFGKLLALFTGTPNLIEIGNEIANGLLKGIAESTIGLVKELWNSFAKPIIDGVMEFFGVHSPSTVFAEIGENLVAGLLQGITETWSSILEFFSSGVDAIKKFFSDAWESIKTATSETWESIKTTLGTIWDGIKSAASTAFENIKTAISTAWENVKTVTSTVWESIKTTLSTLWENLKTTVSTVFENIKTAISTAWENIKSKTTEIWNNIKSTLENIWNNLKTAVTNTFNEIKTKIVEVWTNIKDEAISKWNEIKENISEKIRNIKENIVEGFTNIKENIIGKIQEAMNYLKNMDWKSIGTGIIDGILSGLKGIFSKLRDWASDVWSSITSAFSSSNARSSVSSSAGRRAATASMAAVPVGYQSVQLPKLANGAVIPPNQQFAAILGDQRSGINLEGPESMFRQIVRDEISSIMNGSGMGGDINITVESVLDGRVIARNTVKHVNDMTRSAGKPVLLF